MRIKEFLGQVQHCALAPSSDRPGSFAALLPERFVQWKKVDFSLFVDLEKWTNPGKRMKTLDSPKRISIH